MRFAAETATGPIVGDRAGSGEPALVLHGGPGLSDYTEGLADELGECFSTIRYQQRGNAPSLHGDADPIPGQAAADSAELIEGGCFELVEECGHFPWIERPGTVAAAVERVR